MKFPVLEPLRCDGKTIKPPAEVELDEREQAETIAHLVRRGVIRDVREQTAEDEGQRDEKTDGADDAQGGETQGATDAAEGEGGETPAQEAKAETEQEAPKAEDKPAEQAPAKAETKPAARKGGGKSTAKAKG